MWLEVLSAALFLVSVVSGLKWRQAKKLLKESSEFIVVLSEALADNQVSREELADIAAEGRDVIEAARKLTGR